MSRSKKIVMGVTAFLVVCSLLFWKANLNGQQAASAYPEMWTELSLPKVPAATITQYKKIYKDGEGLSIDFESTMPLEDLTMKLEDDFFKQGFTMWEPDEETPTKYKSSYSTENTDVSVNVETSPLDPSRSIVNIQILRPLAGNQLQGGNVGTRGRSAAMAQ